MILRRMDVEKFRQPIHFDLASHDQWGALMDRLGLDVHNPLSAIRRCSPGLLRNHRDGIGLIQESQLPRREIFRGRVHEYTTTQ